MVNKIRPVLLFCSIYQHFIFLSNGYLFCLFFVAKNSAVQQCSDIKWCHVS